MKKTKHYLRKVLPKGYYKIIENLHKFDKFFLCRLSDKAHPIIRKSNTYPHFIVPKDFQGGLSVNLLSVFNKRAAQFRPLGKVKDPHFKEWKPRETAIYPPKTKFINKANFLGIKIADVNDIEAFNLDITIQKTENDKVVKLTQNNEGYFKPVHSPTKCNFWHCEIQVWCRTALGEEYRIEDNDNISKNGRKRYVDQIASELASKLNEKLRHSSDCKRYRLPKEVYS